MKIEYTPIGIIHTPHKSLSGMPIQPVGAVKTKGTIHLDKQYSDALQSLEGFSHIFLIYHLHRQEGWKQVVTPFMDYLEHGIFATRAPSRPNPIGLSVVELTRIKGSIIEFFGADMLDGTPLLDIKPYIPKFDTQSDVRTGWLENRAEKAEKIKSDKRFI